MLNFPHSPQRAWAPKGKKTFNISDSLVIEAEFQKLLDKGVIAPTNMKAASIFHQSLWQRKKTDHTE